MASSQILKNGNVKTYNYYSSAATTFEHNFSNYCQFIIIATTVLQHDRGNGFWYGLAAANDSQCYIQSLHADTTLPTTVSVTTQKVTITTQVSYVRVSVIEIPF